MQMNHRTQNMNDLSFIHDPPLEIARLNAKVSVYFRDLETQLIQQIKAAEIIVGCIAWLTHFPIIQALANVPKGVSIIIQKEDFIRPDLDSKENWRTELRERYAKLRNIGFWPDSLGIVSDAIEENSEIVTGFSPNGA